MAGQDVELSPEHYAPVSDRDVLLRLQNNIKSRLLQAGRAEPALRIVQTMLLLAPDLAGLWHEAGVLNARLGNMRAAVEALAGVHRARSRGRRAASGRRPAATAQVEAELSRCSPAPRIGEQGRGPIQSERLFELPCLAISATAPGAAS